jgi:hypothetical protein
MMGIAFSLQVKNWIASFLAMTVQRPGRTPLLQARACEMGGKPVLDSFAAPLLAVTEKSLRF